jgi:hypothetical protein
LALNGLVHSSIGTKGVASHDAARKVIWSKLNKDTAGSLKSGTINNYYEEIAENVNSGNLVEIVKSIGDDRLKHDLISQIFSHPFAAGTKGDLLKKFINTDPYLQHFK